MLFGMTCSSINLWRSRVVHDCNQFCKHPQDHSILKLLHIFLKEIVSKPFNDMWWIVNDAEFMSAKFNYIVWNIKIRLLNQNIFVGPVHVL